MNDSTAAARVQRVRSLPCHAQGSATDTGTGRGRPRPGTVAIRMDLRRRLGPGDPVGLRLLPIDLGVRCCESAAPAGPVAVGHPVPRSILRVLRRATHQGAASRRPQPADRSSAAGGPGSAHARRVHVGQQPLATGRPDRIDLISTGSSPCRDSWRIVTTRMFRLAGPGISPMPINGLRCGNGGNQVSSMPTRCPLVDQFRLGRQEPLVSPRWIGW